MAAVLALVMVPLFVSLPLLFGTNDGSAGSAVALATFVVLGTGMVYGLVRFVRGLEE